LRLALWRSDGNIPRVEVITLLRRSCEQLFRCEIGLNWKTYLRRRADQSTYFWVVFGRCRSPHVDKVDIRDGHVRRIQFAERLVRLAIALVDLDRPVVVDALVSLVRDVLHVSGTAPAGQDGLELRVHSGPDLDPGGVAGIGHRVVVDVYVLDDIVFFDVLAQRSDRDTVGTVAFQALHDDVGAVGLERDAVVRVIDDGVLDNDVV
jgi:hypothetical protein